MSAERFSTIPGDLGSFFDHIQVEAAMRNKLDWLEEKVSKFLEKKPTHDEMSKFLVATQDEILGASMAKITGARVKNPFVRFPFPNDTNKKK